jgi:hypothetical protein
VGQCSAKHTEEAVVFRADSATCNASPLKVECTESSRGRILHRSLYAEYLDKVRDYNGTEGTEDYKKGMRKRQVWIEPLFAEAKLWHGLLGASRLRRQLRPVGNAESAVRPDQPLPHEPEHRPDGCRLGSG